MLQRFVIYLVALLVHLMNNVNLISKFSIRTIDVFYKLSLIFLKMILLLGLKL